MAALRVMLVFAVLGAVGWGAWIVSLSLRRNVDVAKVAVMKAPELRTDGVLDEKWLAQTLVLPPKTSLVELDLEKLRTRILADDQVMSAELTRSFPDRLIVKISERSPVARVMTQWQGQFQQLLVARDGVLYFGSNYHPDVLNTLPWLDGVSIAPEGAKLRPIAGMVEVAELLAKARLEAEHLYLQWQVVSLARLAPDHKLEVRTKDGSYIAYFSTLDDYFRQLGKLDYIVDKLPKDTGLVATIDLTLGHSPGGLENDVPVSFAPLPGTEAAALAGTQNGNQSAQKHPAAPARGQGGQERALGSKAPKSQTAVYKVPPAPSRKSQREF